MMSFVPTFLPVEDQSKKLEVVTDEKPESEEVITGDDQKILYIFLVDRSGSMGG